MKTYPTNRTFPAIRTAAAAGLAAPILFGTVLTVLTIVETRFLRTLGWDPLRAPTLDWPSGVPLGPYGAIMTGAFIATGLLTVVFGLGLRRALRALPGGDWGGMLLAAAGIGLMGLASPTDPTLSHLPATLHGRIHDLAYIWLGLTLFPGMIQCGRAFQADPRWRDLARYTWITAGLALPAFGLKGVAVYLYLAAVMTWAEIIAWRLWRQG
jgi:hypothetical protein